MRAGVKGKFLSFFPNCPELFFQHLHYGKAVGTGNHLPQTSGTVSSTSTMDSKEIFRSKKTWDNASPLCAYHTQ
jgi:hypothetical protein